MKKLLIPLCTVALVMAACQKEPSHEDPTRTPGGGGNTEGTKLVRLASRVGDDSLTIDYTYNGLDRIIGLSASGTADSEPVELHYIINRDAANVITSTVVRSPLYVPAGFKTDSIVRKFVYDRTAGRYIRAVSHYVVDDEEESDSTVFNYDATGKLISTISYYGDIVGYELDTKEEYTYAGGNLASVKSYDFDGVGFQLSGTETYEYDSKINPQQAVSDAPALGVLDFYSANNPIKRTTIDNATNDTYVTTVTYTYNSSNRPVISNGTDGTSTSTVSYYYQ